MATLALTRDELAVQVEELELQVQRLRWRVDGARWVNERLGEFLWSKQREVFHSIKANKRTAVKSCHNAGKSFTAARVALWWISIHPVGEARVVTSAPTADHVRKVLWHEINKAHAKAGLPGRVNQTEWFMDMTEENGNRHEVSVAFGRKPDDMNPEAFTGIHERYVLVIFDEADGIGSGLYEAADSLISNDDSRILLIGNPNNPKSEFASACKPGSGYNVITIRAMDTPNFTDEEVPDSLRPKLLGRDYVDQKKRQWGENNAMYISKVLAEFPETSTDGLIPWAWVKAAQDRDIEPKHDDVVEFGVDVGGGGDKNTIAKRRGGRVRIILRNREPNTMRSCGNLIAKIVEHKPSRAKVDEVGIGRGLVERARERRAPVVGVNVGRRAGNTEQFHNLRAEGYWALRERFQAGEVDLDPKDDDLALQLCDIKFKRTSSGKIQIESKDEMKARGKHSPDDADAVMLAFLPNHLLDDQDAGTVEIGWG